MTIFSHKIIRILTILVALYLFVYLSTHSGAAHQEAYRLSWKATWDFNEPDNPNGRLEASIPLSHTQTCSLRTEINTCTVVGNVPIIRGQAWFDGNGYIQCHLPTAEVIRQQVAEQCQVHILDACFIENDTFWAFVKAEPDLPAEIGQVSNPIFSHAYLEMSLLPHQLQTNVRFADQTQVVINHSTTNTPFPSPPLPPVVASQSPPYTFFTYDCQNGHCGVEQWKDHLFLGEGSLPRGVEFFTHIHNTFHIGYSPTTNTYFHGAIDKLVVDPGNFIDHGIMDFMPIAEDDPIVRNPNNTFTPELPRADFNGDGRSDLLWHHTLSNTLSVWLMDGTTQLKEVEIISSSWPAPSWQVVGVNHFNNEYDPTTLSDDSVDILWRNETSGRLSIWLMEGITRTHGVLLDGLPDLNWQVAGTGDFNGDTKADILWRHETSGDLKVWLFNETTPDELINLTPTEPPGITWVVLGTGNFNEDTHIDILWQDQVSGALMVWLMDGVDLLEERPLLPGQLTDFNWKVAALWDVDSNGTTDIVWRNQVSGRLVLWAMEGTSRLCGRFLTPDRWEDLTWQVVGPR